MKHCLPISLTLVIIAALIWVINIQPRNLEVHVFPVAAESRLNEFLTRSSPSTTAYKDLFGYFVEGFDTFKSPSGASASYSGLRSRNGASVDAFEGFSRVAPLFGAWVYSGRTPLITLSDGRVIDIRETFRTGLIAGTDPESNEYWGDIHDLNQRIVEASDIALALWLFRNDVWVRLTKSQQHNVTHWLEQVEGKRVSDNNWHVFPVLISAVLSSLGQPVNRDLAWEHYNRLKQFYRGNGWFSDGPDEIFDYYNAWSFHYSLQWLQIIDPNWDSEFISGVRDQFISTYRYLISPNGFPILGRSICYRMAAPAPLILAQIKSNESISPGEAKRGLDAIWTYFIQRGAVQSGTVVQGYCGLEPALIDNYSGPASCLWALRSLIAAFMLPPDSQFWSKSTSPLPIEQASYQIKIPAISWTIIGDNSNGNIQILKPGTSPNPPWKKYSFLHRAASALLWRPFRPDNHKAKYDGAEYDSAKPFCGCPM
ncbi:MAG: DUF2264 domain-containing protein [Methylococcales bacterium]